MLVLGSGAFYCTRANPYAVKSKTNSVITVSKISSNSSASEGPKAEDVFWALKRLKCLVNVQPNESRLISVDNKDSAVYLTWLDNVVQLQNGTNVQILL